MEKLVSRIELAELLNISVQTLNNWGHIGNGPPFFKLGGDTHGAVRYDLADVRRWLESRRTNDPEPIEEDEMAVMGR